MRLGPLGRQAQVQLNGFKSRLMDASVRTTERRWLYELQWSTMPEELSLSTKTDLNLLLIGDDASDHGLAALGSSVAHSRDEGAVARGEWHAVLFTTPLPMRGHENMAELPSLMNALSLLQTSASIDATPSLWLLTSGTHSMRHSRLAHAGLWGLARACRAEFNALPAWCVDVRDEIHGLAALITQQALRLPSGCVRGLNTSASVEPESAIQGSTLSVPRLVAPYETQATTLNVSFDATRGLLDAHVMKAIGALDMEELQKACTLFQAACHSYVRNAVLKLPEAKVPRWWHKMLYAWGAKQSPSLSEGSTSMSALSDQYPALRPEVPLGERCGSQFAEALAGTVAYTELLFPESSMRLVLPVYEEAIGPSFYNGCVVAAVRMILEQLPSEQRVVALEVGAGSGGTASSVLPIVESVCERYIFTDVSAVFLRQAQVRFAEYSCMEYALLNIDADPRLQQYALHQCDIVIGTNVLHATPFMRNTLRNCVKLLRAGGLLVANDSVITLAFAQITFGMTDGWWLFAEVQDPERIGQDSPLLSWRQWEALLDDSGFGSSCCMKGDAFLQSQAVIVAQAATTAMATEKEERVSQVGKNHFFTGGLGGLGLLAARLLLQGGAERVILSSRSDRVVAGSEADWAQLATGSGNVMRLRCDASDEGTVLATMQKLHSSKIYVDGAFHAAHQLADATLANLKALNFQSAYGPKVHGAIALHASCLQRPLGFFNNFSSISGLLGTSGQSPHSASSAWIHAMAGWRCKLGLRGQSVQWGAVTGVGYAARAGADRRGEARGFGAISRTATIAALTSSLLLACRSFAVLPADWAKLISSREPQGLMAPYFHLRGTGTSPASAAVRTSTVVSRPGAAVCTVGLEEVLRLASRTAGGLVDADTPLMATGIDSLAAVELRNELQNAAGDSMKLPSTVVFDHPTARGLASILTAVEEAAPLPAAADEIAYTVSVQDVVELASRIAGGFVDADAPLMERGVDSLGAVELRNGLQSMAGAEASLPSTVVFDHPTARVLASLFATEAPRPVRVGGARSAPQEDDVSFTGISAMLPGGARGLSLTWDLVGTGGNASVPSPAARWDLTEATRYGAFVHGVELFDARTFVISHPEAATMDPQQRLLLEIGYTALHGSGLLRSELVGSDTGVFVGVMNTEFVAVLTQPNAYAFTGTAHCFAAGRISYVLGLHGPCEATDVACSSALVACHNARVQAGDSHPGALVAGVNLMYAALEARTLTSHAPITSRSRICESIASACTLTG